MRKFLFVFIIFSGYSFGKNPNIKLDNVNVFSIGRNGFMGSVSDGEKIHKRESGKEFAYDFYVYSKQ